MPKARRKNPHRASRFEDMALPQELLDVLAGQGLTRAFEIQEAILPDALAGRDVLARAETGSGKTLAFALAMCARFRGRSVHRRRPLGLVLVPTRELATQVVDTIHPFARAVGIRAQLVAGGMNLDKQAEALRRGVEIIVATPGRLVDLGERGDLMLDRIETTVVDEADHLADLGFLPVVSDILAATEMGTQKMLFSATLDDQAMELVDRFLVDPVSHQTVPLSAAVTTMDHAVVHIAPADKRAVTAQIAARKGKTLLFTRTQLGAERVAAELREAGVHAAALHGSTQQGVRTNILAGFREGAFNALVATDVAARGLHIDDVSCVVHVDPPADVKEYIHRSGRTARAGASGQVVTLALPHQTRDMEKITASAGVVADVHEITGPGDAALRAVGGRAPSGEPVPDPALTKYKGAPRALDVTRRKGADAHAAAARRENEQRRAVYDEDDTERDRQGTRDAAGPDARRSGTGRSKKGRSKKGRSDGGRADGARSDGGRSDGARSDGGRSDSGRSGSGRRGTGAGQSGAGRRAHRASNAGRKGSGGGRGR